MDDEEKLARLAEFCAMFRITVNQYRNLCKHYDSQHINTCLSLLHVHRFRSAYRKRMTQRLRTWLDVPAPQPPFNAHELELLQPKWPVQYNPPH